MKYRTQSPKSNNFDGAKILKKVGLSKSDIKEALKFKPKPKPKIQRRGSISPVKTPCKCGGIGMLQQWIESDSKGNSKLYAMVFCQECDYKTSTHSSSKDGDYYTQEALNEWKLRNRE